MDNIVAAFVLGLSLVIAAYFLGGRYETTASSSARWVYILDRITGEIRLCNGTNCYNTNNVIKRSEEVEIPPYQGTKQN